jgi:hypothetical protein
VNREPETGNREPRGSVLRVEITCSDAGVAFAGEWPAAESAEAIVAQYRERARALGIPIQIAIERRGIWSIAPNGKVVHGSLFDLDKLQAKKKRSTVRQLDRSTVQGKKPKTRP